MTALLDPRRHGARAPVAPPVAPAAQPNGTALTKRDVLWFGGVISSNAGGSVFVLPGATRAHLAELRGVLDAAIGERA
jgi:FAD/FMN-containing dehydrogenase